MSAGRRAISLMTLSLTVLALSAALAWGDDQEEAKPAKIGEKAPEFTLIDAKDQEHELSQYEGRIVILEWTGPECPIVQRHYGSSKAMKKTYEQVMALDRTAVWLAVDSTHAASGKKMQFWIAQNSIEYPILLDTDGTVGRLYDARMAPQMFVIDKEGVLRYRGAIDSNRSGIEPPEKVTHYVTDVVRQLVNGETVLESDTKPYGCSIKYRR